MFQRNEGKIERIIRIALGFVLLAIAVVSLTGVWTWVGAFVGIMLLVTGIVGICPLYTVISLITRKEVCPTCSSKESASLNKPR